MSKVIKPQQNCPVQTAPSLETEEFLSFEDFWQGRGRKTPSPARPRDPREIAVEEAEKIVAQALAEAERIRSDARAEGVARGEAAGLAEGERQYKERLAAVDALLAGLEAQQADLLQRQEKEILTLVTTMVDRLVHHEVATNPLVIQACLRKAMEFVVENSTVRVHVSGEDFNRLKQANLENPGLLAGRHRLQLVEDPAVAPGGCLLETDFGEIDATLENRREKLGTGVERAFLAALADGGGDRQG